MRTIVTLALLITSSFVFSQTGTVKGRIQDFSDNEPMVGVRVYSKGKAARKMTSFDGTFKLELQEGEQYIYVSHVGYEEDSIKVNLQANTVTTINFMLREKMLTTTTASINLPSVKGIREK